MMRDYYVVLGVSRGAGIDAIRKAFKALARKHHPDRNPGDANAERIFKEASAAYAVLADAAKRRLYDEFGYEGLAIGFNPERARFRRTAAKSSAYGEGVSMDAILSGMYGGGAAKTPDAAPKNRSQGPFYDTDSRRAPTQQRSTREPPGANPFLRARPPSAHRTSPPPPAHSTRVRTQSAHPPPAPRTLRTSVHVDALTALHGGDARVKFMRPTRIGALEEVTLRVTIPANTQDGATMRLRGQAGQSRSGQSPGDVLLEIRVDQRGPLRQAGRDLEMFIKVTIGEAMLGGRVEVQTPMRTLKVIIPSGSDSGTRIRIRGMGAPAEGSRAAGDLILILQPVMPDQLSEEMLELVRKLEDYYTGPVRD